jgi:hypothetical protein
VTYQEVHSILEACHDSICSGHFFGRLTTQKALRSGYFWQLCLPMPIHMPNVVMLANVMHLMTFIWIYHYTRPYHLVPFDKWGIDFIGQVYPSSSRGMKYIIVAIEYFTKWAEAKAVKVDDAKATATFLYENVITRFGCPKIFISDRDKHFFK